MVPAIQLKILWKSTKCYNQRSYVYQLITNECSYAIRNIFWSFFLSQHTPHSLGSFQRSRLLSSIYLNWRSLLLLLIFKKLYHCFSLILHVIILMETPDPWFVCCFMCGAQQEPTTSTSHMLQCQHSSRREMERELHFQILRSYHGSSS